MPRPRSVWTALLFAAFAVAIASPGPGAASVVFAQTDLDAFMQQVMARRDDNWKKLQQYILDEKQEIDFRGPARIPLWGERREFTWYIKDGFFVRSPVKVNGAAVSEDDRRKYEASYLRREQQREKRRQERDQQKEQASGAAAAQGADQQPSSDQAAPAADAVPTDLEGFIRQTREPEFVSTAYFMGFRFDEGRYALVGREKLDGQDVLRVEYYPTKLFTDEPKDRQRERERANKDNNNKAVDATVNRLMNKGSRVTMWIVPASHQIVQYTFDNVNFDFLPAQWLASVSGLHASMTMGQPFPDVWLPRDLRIQVSLMLAIGELTGQYTQSYSGYRQAEVTTGLRIPGDR